MFGLVVGLIRMVLEFFYMVPSCGEEDLRPAVLKDLHYLYFAIILCGLTAAVIILVSLCTPPIPEENVSDNNSWLKSLIFITLCVGFFPGRYCTVDPRITKTSLSYKEDLLSNNFASKFSGSWK